MHVHEGEEGLDHIFFGDWSLQRYTLFNIPVTKSPANTSCVSLLVAFKGVTNSSCCVHCHRDSFWGQALCGAYIIPIHVHEIQYLHSQVSRNSVIWKATGERPYIKLEDWSLCLTAEHLNRWFYATLLRSQPPGETGNGHAALPFWADCMCC